MTIEIDPHAGFCFGVRKAVQAAEEILAAEGSLYCLGDLVHNETEVARLAAKGLITIDHETFKTLKNCKVLIRAHGEPPETYWTARQHSIELVEATCPIVLKLQDKIEDSYQKIKDAGGQVVIFGKKGHAEVRGLEGQTGYYAIVIEKIEDLDGIDFAKPLHLYAQTTQDKDAYARITEEVKNRSTKAGKGVEWVQCTASLCNHVSGRIPHLQDFCRRFDTLLFVSSPKSSNGKLLFETCRRSHSHSFFITQPEDIQPSWFRDKTSVGITGATSTPFWLMEQIALHVKNITEI